MNQDKKEWFVTLYEKENNLFTSSAQKSVFLAIKSYTANGKRPAALSTRQIAERAKISQPYVTKIVDQLLGILIEIVDYKTRRGGNVPVYQVISELSVNQQSDKPVITKTRTDKPVIRKNVLNNQTDNSVYGSDNSVYGSENNLRLKSRKYKDNIKLIKDSQKFSDENSEKKSDASKIPEHILPTIKRIGLLVAPSLVAEEVVDYAEIYVSIVTKLPRENQPRNFYDGFGKWLRDEIKNEKNNH